MELKTEVILNALAIILFLGFGTACVIAFTTLDKQKEIVIPSRYGRQVGPLEIVYVNVALVLVAAMLYFQNYRFLPSIIAFVLLIFFNSRMSSGISHGGVFIGFNYLEWNRIAGYRIINDEISTVQIRVYANKKQYVIRCDKEMRKDAEHLFIENGIELKREENNEAFN
ncbi:MAG: hypothetical protein E7271_00390 [Lachnospiraceae bacterium]|jgi:hypothetical protein|nr:hypothetical protein [Lachnospiraceae bacterium]